jgi:uncharacterized membrane protein
MIYRAPGLPLLFLLLLLLSLLVLFIKLRVLAYAYRKVGVHPRYMLAVLLLTLAGGHVNIPLYAVPVGQLAAPQEVRRFARTYRVPDAVREGSTVVGINVGGALIPIAVSIYLLRRTRLYIPMTVGVAVVALIVHGLADVVPGVGIAVPMLVPPLAAAAIALVVAFRRAPPVAYVAGSMGALIGGDLANLSRIGELGAPVVSIGGAGTFDGVFLTGIIAGLLA